MFREVEDFARAYSVKAENEMGKLALQYGDGKLIDIDRYARLAAMSSLLRQLALTAAPLRQLEAVEQGRCQDGKAER